MKHDFVAVAKLHSTLWAGLQYVLNHSSRPSPAIFSYESYERNDQRPRARRYWIGVPP